ncbi:MAG: bifunctional hydroxymethylpyrimidine kinase/phosphomethylpyrimidine kinase [Oscillospiraceae bacterium]|nr:bifunctional hydroxymethylpyrimidine kinase/phosphomethylpyrimidine kinase [Oscillospiraceae bacterium]
MSEKKAVIGAVGLGGESVFLSVDHFHGPGETLHAKNLYIEAGGKAYNQAVAAARLGADVTFIGAIGDDGGGRLCRDVLVEEGIRPVLETVPGFNTAYACILTDREGENRVTVSRGAADRLSAAFIRENEKAISRCTHLLLGLECPLEATVTALEIAKKHGVFTILNPAPAVPLELEFLRSFDLITPNQHEAAVLLGLDEIPETGELAELLYQAKLSNAVVTLGGKGALLVTASETLLFPALKVNAVDTTGAGDTFNAALAVAIGNGRSMAEAVEFATNASAWSVSRPHVLSSLPSLAQLRESWRPVEYVRL